MVPIDKIIFLDGKVPIRTIQEPYCKKCMNIVIEGEELCNYCLYPNDYIGQWHFNKIIALGNYKTYEIM